MFLITRSRVIIRDTRALDPKIVYSSYGSNCVSRMTALTRYANRHVARLGAAYAGRFVSRFHPYARAGYAAYRAARTGYRLYKAVTKRKASALGPPAKRQRVSTGPRYGSWTQTGKNTHYHSHKLIEPISHANKILAKGAGMVKHQEYEQNIIQVDIGKQATSDTLISLWTPYDVINYTRFSGGGINRDPFLAYCKVRVMGTSVGIGNILLKVYQLVARKDMTEESDSPYLHWAQSNIDEGATGAYQFPGSDPRQAALFRANWKVEHVWTKPLSGGESFTFDFFHAPNRRMSGAKIEQFDDAAISVGYGAFRGLTRHFMFVAHGMPYNPVTDGNTYTNVSTGQGKIDILVSKWYGSKTFEAQSSSIAYANTLPTTFSGGQQLLDVDEDKVTYDEA